MEKLDCVYISAKLHKFTYTYVSLQFTGEMNIRGSKKLTTLMPFNTNYDCRGRLLMNEGLFYMVH